MKPEARGGGVKNQDAFVQHLCRCILAELLRRGLLRDTMYHDKRYHDKRHAQAESVPKEGGR